ncbi:type II secretion system protein GspC [Tolumonas lignilytica]|uniref:type II secretion system protein GspC n=1 Tax=Tolumonas lignilytica TaxID=1283284 RepID=UPI000466ECC5|nr:type II secretion system protein GspC [Tolumonas lignilytica]
MRLLTIRDWFLSENGLNTIQRMAVLFFLLGCSYQLAQLTWHLLPLPQTTTPLSPASSSVNSRNEPQDNQQRLVAIRNAALFGVAQLTSNKAVQTDAPKSRLNAQLTGIMASSIPSRSIAIIARNNQQQSYQIGDVIQGTDARIDQILPDRVIITRQQQQEALLLDENASATTASSSAVSAPASISDVRQQLLKNPGQLLDYLSITPVRENNQLKGYRLNPGHHSDIFNQSGLQPNDLAISINGLDLRNSSEAAQAMQQLTHMSEMNITVERNGIDQDVYINLAQP